MIQSQTYPKSVEELKEFSFFILDLIEKKSIAIELEIEHGYKGISFIKENGEYNLSPFYIAKTFIESEVGRYDFTKDYLTALNHCS